MKKILFCFLFAVLGQWLIAQQTQSLAGQWLFKIDRSNEGITKRWFKHQLNNDNDYMSLPGSMLENRKGDDITLNTKWTASIYDSSFYFNPALAKYRQPDNLKIPFMLTPLKHYVGVAWYQKRVTIPSGWKKKNIFLFLERAHIQTMVWVDNHYVGSQLSLTTPHCYDITKYISAGCHRITIRIDNSLKTTINPGKDSHSVTDQTQGNWNGIIGKIELQARPSIYFKNIQVFPDITKKAASVKITLAKTNHKSVSGVLVLSAKSFNTDTPRVIPSITVTFHMIHDTKQINIVLPIGDQMQLWSEFSPTLYKLHVLLKAKNNIDQQDIEFGMRKIDVKGKWIYVNNIRTLMRGTVENCVFPLTGYPPMEVAPWERIFNICKSFGINHMRFHSYCPPEAAFKAADLTGIYLQPEGPSWPNHGISLGRGLPIDTFLMSETKRMDTAYGNYASFCMLAAGNEPRGNWVPWASKFVDYWKKTDNRRIYTGFSVGGGWAWQPANQYQVKAGARGLNWANQRPETISDFRHQIDTVKEPYISHETGQWCAFPDFSEIEKYTGVNRAKNFELFRDILAKNDMADMAQDFLMASGKLQVLCYKNEIEKILRTPNYEGFQLLSLTDYPGQGTALVGVLNSFWDEKGYVTSSQFRHFCNATVPLVQMPKFVYKNDETLHASAEIIHYTNKPLINACPVWKIKDTYGNILQSGKFPVQTIPVGSHLTLGEIKVNLKSFAVPCKLNLEVALKGTSIKNNWNFWVYPDTRTIDTTNIYVCHTLDQKAEKILNEGGKVLLIAAGHVEYGKDIIQYYQPVFWNTSWFKMRPPHTTGVYINNHHPIFQNFVTGYWGNLQWWELLNHAQVMQLTDFPKGFHPLVQPIDTWFLSRKLGMLFEAQVGKGKIVVTSIDLENNLKQRPVAKQLLYSITQYMNSSQFYPQYHVNIETIRELFTKSSHQFKTYTHDAPDELKKTHH